MSITEYKSNLLNFVNALNERGRRAKQTMSEGCFDPDVTDITDKLCGEIFDDGGKLKIRIDVKGLKYEGRTSKLEKLNIGDTVTIQRDGSNVYNHNNFNVFNDNADLLGALPAQLCNVIAPLYDENLLIIESAKVFYVEKIQERSRYAQQGVLLVELHFGLLV